MFAKILFLTFLFSSFELQAQESAISDFEAELRALESNQLRAEEIQMMNVDAVTDVISDEVATGQAATVRPKNIVNANEKPEKKEEPKSDLRVRRIRSR